MSEEEGGGRREGGIHRLMEEGEKRQKERWAGLV